MMKKIKLIKIICFLFCFAILCFSEDFYELKNKGIKFIKKGKHVYGQINLDFSEKTLIQESEKDENYMFSRIVDIKVDKEENIYIIDFKRVLKYLHNGF
jgi:ATP-dependent exoDNAse (exonuclease V) beta subunit